MNTKSRLFAGLSILMTACATSPEQPANVAPCPSIAPAAVATNNYPTRDRVDYVLECVSKHGKPSYVTQYACGCKIDNIAEQLTFEEYEAARTIGFMQKAPGESGAAFRDPKHAKDLKSRLKEAEEKAEKACFIK